MEQISSNLLPYDGIVEYYPSALSHGEAKQYYQDFLQHIDWQNDRVKLFGKEIITKRKIAWYGDEKFTYTYSNDTKTALPWTDELLGMKQIVELKTKERYNSCFLNLYHNGSEAMGWHTDDEPELLANGAIASVSLGATRKFVFKHKESKEKVEVMLASGSILVMKGSVQHHWLHRLPPTKKVNTPRVNLTYRTIVE